MTTSVLVHFIIRGDSHPFCALPFSPVTPLSLVRQSLSDYQSEMVGRLHNRRWIFHGVDLSLVHQLEDELKQLTEWVIEQEKTIGEQRAWRRQNPNDAHLMTPEEFFAYCHNVSQKKMHCESLKEHIVHTRNKVEGWRFVESLFPSIGKHAPRDNFCNPYAVTRGIKRSGSTAPKMAEVSRLLFPIAKVLHRTEDMSPRKPPIDDVPRVHEEGRRFKFVSRRILSDVKRKHDIEKDVEVTDEYKLAVVTIDFVDLYEHYSSAESTEIFEAENSTQPNLNPHDVKERLNQLYGMSHSNLAITLNIADHLGNTPLHVLLNRKTEIVEGAGSMIERGVRTDILNWKGWTAWHVAAYRGHENVILLFGEKRLRKQLMHELAIRDKIGRTPIHIALERKHLNVVRKLISLGGLNSHLPPPKNFAESEFWDLFFRYLSPLDAVARDDTDELVMLIQQLSINVNDRDIGLKLSLLEYSVIHKSANCVAKLIAMDSRVTAKSLIIAVSTKQYDLLLNQLIPHAKNLKDESISKVLRRALISRTKSLNNLDRVTLELFDRLAPSSVPLEGKSTIVHLCMLQKTTGTLAAIFKRLEYASDVTLQKLVEWRNEDDDTILGCAIRSDFFWAVSQLLSFRVLNTMVDKFVSRKRLPLLFAVQLEVSKNLDPSLQRPFSEYRLNRCVTRMLLQNPTCSQTVNTPSGLNMKTPLQVAVEAGSWHVTSLLLSFGAFVRPQEDLIRVASGISTPLVQILLANAGGTTLDEVTLTTLLGGTVTGKDSGMISHMSKQGVLDLQGDFGYKLLLSACEYDNLESVAFFINQGCCMFSPNFPHTPLQILLNNHNSDYKKNLTANRKQREALCWELLKRGCPPGVTTEDMDSGLLLGITSGFFELSTFAILTAKLEANETCRRYGRSVLHWAVIRGLDEVVRNLTLDSRIDIDKTDRLHGTPIQYALQQGNLKAMCHLLQTGRCAVRPRLNHKMCMSDFSVTCPLIEYREGMNSKIPARYYCNTLVELSFQNCTPATSAFELLQRCLSRPMLLWRVGTILKHSISSMDPNGWQLSHYAAAKGFVDSLIVLHAIGLDMARQTPHENHTPFSLLMLSGCLSNNFVLKIVNEDFITNQKVQLKGNSHLVSEAHPLVLAIPHLRSASMISHFTALLSACNIDKVAQPITMDGKPSSIVHILFADDGWKSDALRAARDALCTRMIPFNKRDVVDVIDVFGRSALDWACQRGARASVLSLLRLGASPLNAFCLKSTFKSFGHWVFSQSSVEDVAASVQYVSQRYTTGWMSALESTGKYTRHLVQCANPWTLRTTSSVPALHRAASRIDFASFFDVVASSGNVNVIEDINRETALMTACKHGNVRAVEILLAHSASVEELDVRGYSAFSHAASRGSVECLDALLKVTDPSVAFHLLKLKGKWNKSVSLIPFEIALYNSKDAAALFLAKRLPKESLTYVEPSTNNSYLHLCARFGNLECAKFLLGELEHAAVTRLNKQGESLLDIALSFFKPEDPIVVLFQSVKDMPLLQVDNFLSNGTVINRMGNLKRLHELGAEGVKFLDCGRKPVVRNITESAWYHARLKQDELLVKDLQTGKDDWKRILVTGLPTFEYFMKNIFNPELGQKIENIAAYRDRLKASVVTIFANDGGISKVEHDDESITIQVVREEAIEEILAPSRENLVFYCHKVQLARAPPRGPSYREDTVDGETSLLHVMCQNGCSRSVAFVLTNNSVLGDVRPLVRNMFCKYKDPHGYTPFHYACAQGHVGVVSVLLRAGLEPTTADNSGTLPLAYLPSPSTSLFVTRAAPLVEVPIVPLANESDVEVGHSDKLASNIDFQADYFDNSTAVVWQESSDATQQRVRGADVSMLFLCKTAYEKFSIIHKPDDIDTSIVVKLTRDIFCENITTAAQASERKIRDMMVKVCEIAVKWNMLQQPKPFQRRESKIMRQSFEMTPLDHAVDYALQHNVLSVVDPTKITHVLLAHLKDTLQITMDMESVEEMSRPGDVARAKSLILYGIEGGVIGRIIEDLVTTYIIRYGSFGQICLTRLRSIKIRMVPSEEMAVAYTKDTGFVLNITWNMHPGPYQLYASSLRETLDKYFLSDTILLFHNFMKRLHQIQENSWAGKVNVYIKEKVVTNLLESLRAVQEGRMLDLMDFLYELRMHPKRSQINHFIQSIMDVFDDFEDGGVPRGCIHTGEVTIALRPWRRRLPKTMHSVSIIFQQEPNIEIEAKLPTLTRYDGLRELLSAASPVSSEGLHGLNLLKQSMRKKINTVHDVAVMLRYDWKDDGENFKLCGKPQVCRVEGGWDFHDIRQQRVHIEKVE